MSIDSRTALERRAELQSNRVEQYARMVEMPLSVSEKWAKMGERVTVSRRLRSRLALVT